MSLNLPPYPQLKFWNFDAINFTRYEPLSAEEWQKRQQPYKERWCVALQASDICVVDIDVKEGRTNGLAYARDELGWNIEKMMLSTYAVRTKSGGLHLYFKRPAHINKKSKLGGCIDLLVGNAFVWCTPTVGYNAVNTPETLAELPSCVERLWCEDEEETAAVQAVKEVDSVEEYKQNCVKRARQDVASSIPGERNDVLNKAAYWLGQVGVDMAEAKKELVKATMTNGDWAEDEKKVLSTIKRAYADGQKHPKEIVEKEACASPEEVRGQVIALLSSHYRRHDGDWYEHVGESAYWKRVSPSDVERAVLTALPGVIYGAVPNRKKQNILLGSANMLSMMRCTLSQWPAAPNTDEHNVFMSGDVVIDTRTGHPIDGRDLFLTKRSTVPFIPERQCPQWLAFLHNALDGDEEMIEWLRRAMAYSLTAATHWQCLFFIYGRAKTGKSTFMKVLSALAGEYMVTAPDRLLVGSRSVTRNTELGLHRIMGARIVVQNEIAEGRRFNSDLLKALSAGDTVEARGLYRAGQTYQSVAKVWFVANDMPHFSETDDGLHRRMRIIPFNKVCGEVIPHFYEKVLAPELPGIVNWVLAVMPEVYQKVDTIPERTRLASEEVIEEESPVGLFCKDILLEDNVDGFTRFSQCFDLYQDWCRDTGRNIPDQNQRMWFSRTMCRVLGVKSTVRRFGASVVRGFKGFSINPLFCTHRPFDN